MITEFIVWLLFLNYDILQPIPYVTNDDIDSDINTYDFKTTIINIFGYIYTYTLIRYIIYSFSLYEIFLVINMYGLLLIIIFMLFWI